MLWLAYLHWHDWSNDAALLPIMFVPVALGAAKLLMQRDPPPVAIAVLGVLGLVLALVGGAHLSGSVAFQTAMLQAIAFWFVIWRRFKSASEHDA
jgi:hypothetical protein